MTFDLQPIPVAAEADAPAILSASIEPRLSPAAKLLRAYAAKRYMRLGGQVNDGDLLVAVTGVAGLTEATWPDVLRLVLNLHQRGASLPEILWRLEVLEGAYDRLHPGPMLVNPFVAARVSVAARQNW
ncbi:hypothetical protein CDN99_04155 [Roseateles aquatilis]|uniref:Uncharacterized protein n=1 Tax=Roseateles aquatilis TaxID=431061 RepID=A0A246JLY4_9BURK|nr:hypothetical protein [Roseateles aquatilis]OWQ93658.1 hypothetical protein CDN99_04155 [Roseateles aquatilis]